jgi:CelD/BcsL family acetyltransferase involved in cellulose biosynthesis
MFNIRVVALNTAVDPGADMCLEYNGVLARRGYEQAAEEKLLAALRETQLPWGELHVRNLAKPGFVTGAAAALRRVTDDPFNGWCADLSPGLARDGILQRLSANRRSQIRRSLKASEQSGALHVQEAESAETALAYFSRLGELHNARWRRAGIAGAFESPNWVRFHQAVIARGIGRGEIQLLRVTAGNEDLGYLYNLRWRNTVAMIQSGFIEPASNAHRPRFVCHLLAMEYNAARGATVYDFLGGNAEYKRVLADRPTCQENLRLQRPESPSFRIEEALVQLVRRWRGG